MPPLPRPARGEQHSRTGREQEALVAWCSASVTVGRRQPKSCPGASPPRRWRRTILAARPPVDPVFFFFFNKIEVSRGSSDKTNSGDLRASGPSKIGGCSLSRVGRKRGSPCAFSSCPSCSGYSHIPYPTSTHTENTKHLQLVPQDPAGLSLVTLDSKSE